MQPLTLPRYQPSYPQTIIEADRMAAKGIKSLANSVFNKLWLIVCIGGCISQVWVLSKGYFSREEGSKVTIEFPKTFKPPTVSICFTVFELLDWDKVLAKYQTVKEQLDAAGISVADKASVKQALQSVKGSIAQRIVFKNIKSTDLFDLTLGGKELFVFCGSLNEKDCYVRLSANCLDIYTIVPYLLEEKKCFNFIPKNVLLINRDSLRLSPVAKTSIFYSRLKREVMDRFATMDVYIHPHDTYPRGRKYISVTLSDIISKIFTLTYSRTSSKYLTAPFPDNCTNYGTIGFESQEHCLEDCVTKNYLKMFKTYPYISTIKSGDESTRDALLDIYLNSTFTEASQFFRKECEIMWPQTDCFHENLVAELVSTEVAAENTTVLLRAPYKADITLESYQKVSFIEYISNVFSAFSFWFGFSILTCYDFVSDQVSNYCGSKSPPVVRQNLALRLQAIELHSKRYSGLRLQSRLFVD